MDFLLEIIFEIIGGIWEAIIESDRVPKWVRYILMAIPILGLLTLVVVGIIRATEVMLVLFLIVLGIGLLVLYAFLVRNVWRSGILKKAKKEDLPEILRMYRSVIGKPCCTWSITYPNEATLYEDFRNNNLFVLWRGKKIIGAGSVVSRNELDDLDCWKFTVDTREIARIVIRSEYQGKGYGKHLVNKLCLRLERLGCKVVHILVAKENHHALNLYRECSFHCMGECHRFDHDFYAYERKL